MANMSYLDASAITKFAVVEPESAAMETYAINRDALISSRLSEVEVLRAVRRARSKALDHAREALEAVFLREVDADVVRQAGLIDPPELRSGDAIQLATALAMQDPQLDFVTYDKRLARAAEAAGLRVVQPGRDPQTRTWDRPAGKDRSAS